MTEFFHMGGYAFYVWTSYGVVFLVLLLTFLAPLHRRHKIIALIKSAQTRKEKLARRRT